MEGTNKQSKLIIIDGDILAYKVAISNQENYQWDEETETVKVDPVNALLQLDEYIEELLTKLKATKAFIAISSPENFRKIISDTYKANRTQAKPQLLNYILEVLVDEYGARSVPTLEADDLMGLLATDSDVTCKKVLVSIDKDMLTIPCTLYNPDKDVTTKVTEDMANYNFFIQVITGDQVDNYKGVPYFGKKKAEKLLSPLLEDFTGDELYKALEDKVKELYELKGLTEEYYFEQHALARILRFK